MQFERDIAKLWRDSFHMTHPLINKNICSMKFYENYDFIGTMENNLARMILEFKLGVLFSYIVEYFQKYERFILPKSKFLVE